MRYAPLTAEADWRQARAVALQGPAQVFDAHQGHRAVGCGETRSRTENSAPERIPDFNAFYELACVQVFGQQRGGSALYC